MERIDLNGLWDFVVDLDPKYHGAAYAETDWDRRNWQRVTVPGVWNRYEPGLDIYEGVCWYAREFDLPQRQDFSRAFLRFGAVNYLAQVYLNGQAVGTHEGGYTEFAFDVKEQLRPGRNLLVVRVDNRATSTRLPAVLGYFNYGGIHRDVAMELYHGDYLGELCIDADWAGGIGRVDVRGVTEASSVRVECHGQRTAVTPDRAERFALQLEVPGVTPWSPKVPSLYPLTINDRRIEIGFRRFGVRGREILLNGEPIRLNGICYLYDSPRHGLVMTADQYEQDIALFKELGVNAIRSHFPFTDGFYTACDRAGILVWIETPVYCIHPRNDETGTVFSDASFRDLAMQMLREMIASARNHPCVAIYGIGNECNMENREAEEFFRRLAAEAKSLDPSRAVSYACLYGNVGPIGEIVDIIGINEYWGWYDRLRGDGRPSGEPGGPANLQPLHDQLAKLSAQYEKPLLLTEFGADSCPGFRSDALELWSEDYHAYLLRETIGIARQYPAVCGTFPFCFADYRDPSKYVGAHWDAMNYKGALTHDRQPKAAFHALVKLYGQKHA